MERGTLDKVIFSEYGVKMAGKECSASVFESIQILGKLPQL